MRACPTRSRHGLASDLPERRSRRQQEQNQAAAARTIGIKRIDAARSYRKPWLALVLHVSRITPGKCTAGLNKALFGEKHSR
jgi:hypothetical protein